MRGSTRVTVSSVSLAPRSGSGDVRRAASGFQLGNDVSRSGDAELVVVGGSAGAGGEEVGEEVEDVVDLLTTHLYYSDSPDDYILITMRESDSATCGYSVGRQDASSLGRPVRTAVRTLSCPVVASPVHMTPIYKERNPLFLLQEKKFMFLTSYCCSMISQKLLHGS